MKYLLAVLLLCCNWVAQSQSVFQKTKNCVGFIQFDRTDSGKITKFSGTGSLIFKRLDGKDDFGYYFIVTNKHVLPSFQESLTLDFYFTSADTSKAQYNKITVPIYNKDRSYDSHVKVSNTEDVAIIEISSVLFKNKVYAIESAIPIENFATKSIIKNKIFNIGDVVFFIGYPNFFYNRKNFSPILRTGYIATDPIRPYYFSEIVKAKNERDFLDGFLIDASVFGGSSGSLVCNYPSVLDPEFYKPGHAIITNQRATCWVLGILTESYFTLSSEPYQQRLNIGGVISSEKILELINSYNFRDKK